MDSTGKNTLQRLIEFQGLAEKKSKISWFSILESSEFISKISHTNLKLAKSLYYQKKLQGKLEEKAAEVEEYASQMEELAEERAKKLKDSERMAAIGQTAGMVGHDIRNPLQAIMSELYLERLEVDSLPDGEAKENLLENIRGMEENIVYINKIVADLQDYAKPLNPKREELDVEDVFNGALEMVIVPENVKKIVVIEENLPKLIADSTMVKRILVNLIQNAVQAMPKGGDLTISNAHPKASNFYYDRRHRGRHT